MTPQKRIIFLIVCVAAAGLVLVSILYSPQRGPSEKASADPSLLQNQETVTSPTVLSTPSPAELLAKRQSFATIMERSMLEKGHDFYISLKGKSRDELVIKYVLINRPFVYKFQTEYADSLAQMADIGFTCVHLTDGYSDTWTIPLRPAVEVPKIPRSYKP